MLKRMYLICSAVLLILSVSGCKSDQDLHSVSSGDTGVWSDSGEMSSKEKEKLDFEKSISFLEGIKSYLTDLSGEAASREKLREFEALLEGINHYDLKADAVSIYVGSQYSACKTVVSFYYLNGTEKLLTQKLSDLENAYNELSKLEKNTIIKPDETLFKNAANQLKKLGIQG